MVITRLRLVRYGLSECHLNPYRTQMDTICISYQHMNMGILIDWDKICVLMGDFNNDLLKCNTG